MRLSTLVYKIHQLNVAISNGNVGFFPSLILHLCFLCFTSLTFLFCIHQGHPAAAVVVLTVTPALPQLVRLPVDGSFGEMEMLWQSNMQQQVRVPIRIAPPLPSTRKAKHHPSLVACLTCGTAVLVQLLRSKRVSPPIGVQQLSVPFDIEESSLKVIDCLFKIQYGPAVSLLPSLV